MNPRRTTVVAWLLYACNSTGVGNPAPASLQLAITGDEEPLAAAGGAPATAGAPTSDGETAGSPASDGGATTTGDEATPAEGGAVTAEGGHGGSPVVDEAAGLGGASSDVAVLPRAAIDDALLVIGEVRFLACEAGESAVVVAGPFVVDLVHGGTSPTIPRVLVPAGGFCGLDAPLAPAAAPARLAGRSVYFAGERVDGTPFRFVANVEATLRVRARAGVSWGLEPTPARSAFWALRPRQWLEPGELNALEATALDDGSGGFGIDLERHPALLRAIRSRLAGRSTLYDDVNDDNTFDAADRDAVLGDGVPDAD